MQDELQPNVRPLTSAPRPARGRAPRVLELGMGLLDSIEGGAVDTMILPIWSDERPLRGLAGLVDWRTCGGLSEPLRRGFFEGALGEALLTCSWRVPSAGRILLLGLGRRGALDRAELRAAGERAFAVADGIAARRVIFGLPSGRLDPSMPLAIAEGAQGRLIGAQEAAGDLRSPPLWWFVSEPELLPYLQALG